MSSRAVLPSRRPSWRRKFSHGPLSYFGTVSFYGDAFNPDTDRPAEIFIDCAKSHSDAAVLAEAAAIYASFALQYGCPISKLATGGPKLEDGSPAEPVGAFLNMVARGDV